MDELAAIQGDFVGLNFIKGRKVCQIVIETPIEAGVAIVKAFGTPNPAITIPVVVARMDAETTKATKEEKHPSKPKGGRLSREAAMICQEGAFWKFMEECAMGTASNSEEAAAIIRKECSVSSRSELDHNIFAANRFNEIKASYKLWMIT